MHFQPPENCLLGDGYKSLNYGHCPLTANPFHQTRLHCNPPVRWCTLSRKYPLHFTNTPILTMIAGSIDVSFTVVALSEAQIGISVAIPPATRLKHACSVTNLWLHANDYARDRVVLEKTQEILVVHPFHCQSIHLHLGSWFNLGVFIMGSIGLHCRSSSMFYPIYWNSRSAFLWNY